MTSTARILAVLAEQPSTSYEVHMETDIPFRTCCAFLHKLAKKQRIQRQPKMVKYRPRSNGAWVYHLPESPKPGN